MVRCAPWLDGLSAIGARRVHHKPVVDARHMERVLAGKDAKGVPGFERPNADGAGRIAPRTSATILSHPSTTPWPVLHHWEGVNGFKIGPFPVHWVLALSEETEEAGKAAAHHRKEREGNKAWETHFQVLDREQHYGSEKHG